MGVASTELKGTAPSSRTPVLVCVAALAGLSAAAVILGDGRVAVAVAPIALAALAVTVWRLPLRDTLPVLAFVCMTLDNPNDVFALGQWGTPLATVGALFFQHINVTVPIRGLIFSGLDVALVLFGCVVVYRRATGSDLDTLGFVPAAAPVKHVAVVCLVTILWTWGYGLARGGSFANSLWQVYRVIYLPCVLLLFVAGLRGPEDAGRLGRVLVAAAVYRGILAIYIRHLFPSYEELAFATTHVDSMLFANAFILVVASFLERPTRRAAAVAAVLLPLLTVALIVNNRRLAWVELAFALAILHLIVRPSAMKRRVSRAVVLALPLVAIYVGLGWRTPTGPFAPVRTIRTVVDSSADTSTFWRDLENYNLYYTLRQNPLLGTGFGHEYIEKVPLPDISVGFDIFRYAPHNSVVGLFAFAGLVGFAGIWMILPLGIFLAVRTYRATSSPRDRIAALTVIGVLVTYQVHCYGDMALGTWTSVFTVAAAVALIGKMAVATGAWPARRSLGSYPGVPPKT